MHESTAHQIVLSTFLTNDSTNNTYCGHTIVYGALIENSDLFLKCNAGERLFDASCIALIPELKRYNMGLYAWIERFNILF